MGAGARNQRFRFFSDAGTTDTAAGTHEESPSVVCTRWGRFAPIGDAAFEALRSLYPGAHFGLEIAYDTVGATLTSAHRATLLNTLRAFDVLGTVDPDAGRRVLHIALAERFPQRTIAA